MRSLRVALVAAAACVSAAAQYGTPLRPDVLLVARFHTPLPYQTVLTKLDDYYQEQVGHKLLAAFPKIAEGVHYEIWHDMWVFFAPAGGGVDMTIKRPTDSATALLAKTWILEMAGRCGGEAPAFEELPPLRSAESNLSGSRREVARVMEAQPSFHLVDSWQHTGLLVSAAPLSRIVMERAGGRGVHRLTVTAEALPAAKQLAAKLNAAMTMPGVYAAYSETAEINAELRHDAIERSEDVNATTVQRIYMSRMDPQLVEDTLRSEPEMRRRLAAAEGWFAIKYRVDRAYAKVDIQWTELTGYTRENGKFLTENPLGASTAANIRVPPPGGAPLTGRTKLGSLKPGAYRIAIEGETTAGVKTRIDQRDYWFDGKIFEEL
jgi:hypothetical protein